MYHFQLAYWWTVVAVSLLPLTLLGALFVALVLTLHHYHRGNRNRATQLLGSLKRFAQAAAMLWIASLGGVLCWLTEPWPLSLRQGPNTEFARACYRRYLGEIPYKVIHQIYCREEWRLHPLGSISSLRFSFRDTAALRETIKRRSFVPVSVENRSSIRYLSGPSWWPERERLSTATQVYKYKPSLRLLSYDWSVSASLFLWIDEEAGEAFFQQAGRLF